MLSTMLVVAPSQLRADFQRYYGLDLDEVGYTIRVRRAADLAANLPEQAAIWRAINQQATWDTSQYLLADMADSLRFLAWTKTSEASKRGAKFTHQIPRPGTNQTSHDSELMQLDIEQADQLMNQWYPNLNKRQEA